LRDFSNEELRSQAKFRGVKQGLERRSESNPWQKKNGGQWKNGSLKKLLQENLQNNYLEPMAGIAQPSPELE